MKIDLGQHETQDGRKVLAWIEPNFPAFRAGAVRDNGFLCVELAADDGAEATRLRLESMSEEAWKLHDAVGAELARQLWDERRKYDAKPFYLVHDHPQYGRLYFEPWAVIGSAPSVAFFTRTDLRYAKEGTVIPEAEGPSQLEALFLHEKLNARSPLVPETHELAEAIQYGKAMAGAVMAARAEYAAHVDWDFDRRLETVMLGATGRMPLLDQRDIDRYEVLSSWAVRPAAHQFAAGTPEFLRWHDGEGQPRFEPLTVEQLAGVLQERGLSAEFATAEAVKHSIPAADWEWFKDKRLGRMRMPVETLHQLISTERGRDDKDVAWIEQAFTAADFCATMPAGPAKVHSAIAQFVELHGGEITQASRQAVLAALTHLQNPANGLAVAETHPAAKVLTALDALHSNNVARLDALAEGDKASAARFEEQMDELTVQHGQFERAADPGRENESADADASPMP